MGTIDILKEVIRGDYFMRINCSNLDKILAVYKKQGIQPGRIYGETKDNAQQRADRIELSQQAMDFQVALKALSGLPDIREQKVADIKSRIEAGKYRVEARDIADRIIDRLRSRGRL
jgi:negative regulator of flagellin synthesis FlgM